MPAEYEPVNLSHWTMPANYFGEVWPAYYSAGVGQSRDSDALERSNFICMLEAIGGESETVTVVRESHWAVGWVEWIAIHQDDDKALTIADEIKGALTDYPVVDEGHYSELEFNEAAEYWESMPPREKVEWALEQRRRCHWLTKLPVWRFGRMTFYDLGNQEGDYYTIASAIEEQLRSA